MSHHLSPTTVGLASEAPVLGTIGSVENPSKYSAAMTGSRGDEKTKILLRTGKGHLSLGTKIYDAFRYSQWRAAY